MRRKIIRIDEEKCTGCALCIPNCPEGALQVIDGKARLISDLFCDGLGACIGHCPEDAIVVEEREAEEYDEKKVMGNIVKQGKNVIRAHLEHLREHGQEEYLREALAFLKHKNIEDPRTTHKAASHHRETAGMQGCPGARAMDFREKVRAGTREREQVSSGGPSELRQWPVQITLVPPAAPYLKDADLLIAADCVPFAYASFHKDFLKDRVLLVGCPKLDDVKFYTEKITQILKTNDIKSVTCVHMEVPCCFGLVGVVRAALEASGKNIPFHEVTISIRGEKAAS